MSARHSRPLLAASLAVALALAAAAGAWRACSPSRATHVAPAGTPRADPVDEAALQGGGVPAAPVTGARSEARRSLHASRDTDERDVVRVLVVDDDTEEPANGAEVRYLAEHEAYVPVGALLAISPLQWFEGRGTSVRADAAGVALVPRAGLPREGPAVAAFAGDRRASQNVPPDAEEVTLRLAPYVRIPVRVADERGTPVADAAVALRTGDDRGAVEHVRARTAADGTAQLLVSPRTLERPEPRVGLALPLPAPIAVRVDREEPERTIDLVLPRSGELRVVVQNARGDPLVEPLEVRLMLPFAGTFDVVRNDPVQRRLAEPRLATDGSVVFPHVGLGLHLRVEVNAHPSYNVFSAEGVGPTRSGERATLVVRVDRSTLPVLTGRLVDGSGGPLARVRAEIALWSEDEYSSSTSYAQFDTDSGGRFRVELDAGERYVEAKLEHGAAVTSVDLRAWDSRGVHDLGDVTLERAQLVVAGVVVDMLGRPVESAFVLCHEGPLHGKSDAHGRFELRGVLAPDVAEVTVAAKRARSPFCEPVSVPRGTSGLRIELPLRGQVEATLLGDERVLAGCWARLIAEAGDAHGFVRAGAARFDDVAPGTYELAIESMTTGETLARLADLDVPAGPCLDPRLAAIDLRTTARAIVLSVLDASGQPAMGVVAALDERRRKHFDGSLTLVTARPSLELRLGARGHRVVTVAELVEDRVVELQRGVPVRLVLGGAAHPGDGLRVDALLEPDARTWPERQLDVELTFDARGEALGWVGCPGTHDVAIRVWTPHDDVLRQWRSDLVEPPVELVSVRIDDTNVEQVVRIPFAQAWMDAAVESLGRARR